MNSLEAMLKSAEEAAMKVEDPELRKIAFQEILKHSLTNTDASGERPQRPASVRAQKTRSSPSKSTGASAVRAEIATLDLSPDESGLVSWDSLSVDWKKFCWILEAARKSGVDGLTNSEISFLIDKTFRESKTPDVVNNLKVQIKKGMVKSVAIKSGDRDYRVWKILASGIKEVAARPAAVE